MLADYNLCSYHHRIISRILIFLNKICSNDLSPYELKDCLKQTQLFNDNYNLRSNNKIVVIKSFSTSKFGDSSFQNIGATIINSCKSLNFYINSKSFKIYLFNNIENIISDVQSVLSKFNLIVNLDFFR